MLAMILPQPNFKLKLTSFLCAQGQEEFWARYFILFFDNTTESCDEQSFVCRPFGKFFSLFLCARVCVCVSRVPVDTHTALFSLDRMGRLLRKTTWFQAER